MEVHAAPIRHAPLHLAPVTNEPGEAKRNKEKQVQEGKGSHTKNMPETSNRTRPKRTKPNRIKPDRAKQANKPNRIPAAAKLSCFKNTEPKKRPMARYTLTAAIYYMYHALVFPETRVFLLILAPTGAEKSNINIAQLNKTKTRTYVRTYICS